MPSLTEILAAAQAQGAEAARGPQPGRVVSYDATVHSADIEPLVQRPEDTAAPRLRAVPVLWPWGLAGALAAGDLVLLVPCERDISRWAGARLSAVTAPSSRRSALADCVALPMWLPAGDTPLALGPEVDERLGALVEWVGLLLAWLPTAYVAIVPPPAVPPPLPPLLLPTGGATRGRP